jgi:hypothetical protein
VHVCWSLGLLVIERISSPCVMERVARDRKVAHVAGVC